MRGFEVVLILLATIPAPGADALIAGIDFFGYGGINLEAVRA